MQTKTALGPIVDRLKSTVDVDCVFGKPFEYQGKLYVPVATVRYGFGGGGGGAEGKDGHGGMGGGMKSKAAGVLEISAEGARFIRFETPVRHMVAAGIGLFLLVRVLSGLRLR